MRVWRVLSMVLLLIGAALVSQARIQDDLTDWRPMICGFPGEGQSVYKTFHITRPGRYELLAAIPARYQPGSSHTMYEYLDTEKSIDCDFDLKLKSLVRPGIDIQRHIQSMDMGQVSDEFGYSNAQCFWDLPSGDYELTVVSRRTAPLIASRGGYLKVKVAGKPTWFGQTTLMHALGVFLMLIGLISYVVCELKSR